MRVTHLVRVALALAVPIYAGNGAHRITSFDAPGAGTGNGQGTVPVGINALGEITGSYSDALTAHGFVRSADGIITTFDPPNSFYTQAPGINVEGTVCGYYFDGNSGMFRSFLRAPDGTFTVFDAPGAGRGSTGCPVGTFASNINELGEIWGWYTDAACAGRGFLRAPGGKFTTVDPPGAATTSGLGTITPTFAGLNSVGAGVGFFADIYDLEHGFVRAPDGKITEFDPPGSAGTYAASINLWGEITGAYYDLSGLSHTFVRSPLGKFTTFDAPGAGTAGFPQGTTPSSNNIFGTTVGTYVDASNVFHGFVLTLLGAFTAIDVPSAGTGAGQGTTLTANNDSGEVTGLYVDANGASHGFLVK